MSLDVYLASSDGYSASPGSGIFIREDGQTKEVSFEEWTKRHPKRMPAIVDYGRHGDGTLYSSNITHNLGKMAGEAGIYQHLWRPEEIGITTASQLLLPLQDGLARLNSDPARFEALNPANGWGDYDGLVGFVARYLAACTKWPTAVVRVSR